MLGKTDPDEERPAPRRWMWIAATGVAIVLLAGLAGWGGSLLATTPAADSHPIPEFSATTSTSATTPSPAATAAPTGPGASVNSPSDPVPARPHQDYSAPAPAQTVAPAPVPAPTQARAPIDTCVPDPTYYLRQEQTRLQREAQRANLNIRFNMALDAGDVDEAAMIQNEASALEQSWSIEDQMNPPPDC